MQCYRSVFLSCEHVGPTVLQFGVAIALRVLSRDVNAAPMERVYANRRAPFHFCVRYE